MKDLISIIVPVYNVVSYLEKCINSLCNQTYSNIEIILVDDGSTDGSDKLCDHFAEIESRIIVIHKKNGGSTSARNAGLAIAKGYYVGFVDSDDWVELDMYETLYQAIREANADVAIGKSYISHDTGEYIEKRSISSGTYHKMDEVVVHNIIYSDDFQEKGISPNLWDKLFVKHMLVPFQKQVNEQTRYAEDDFCVYSFLLNAECVTFVDKALYHYYMRQGSVTKNADPEYFEKITLFYQQMRTTFFKHKDSEILFEKLNRYMLEFVLRGINTSFGFGYGNIVPYYYPNTQFITEKQIRNLVLYGAGNVGKDYYSYFTMNHLTEIVGWLDREYSLYSEQGYPVNSPDILKEMSNYDAILIAVDNQDVAEGIKESLINRYGIDEKKIFYYRPQKIVSKIK